MKNYDGNYQYGHPDFRRAHGACENHRGKGRHALQTTGRPRLEKWLDNQEVCDILGISKRTLQEYRAKGLLPFGRIKNKLFYKPEDVEKVLQSYYHANSKKL